MRAGKGFAYRDPSKKRTCTRLEEPGDNVATGLRRGSAGELDLVDEMLGVAHPAPAKIFLAVVQLDLPVTRDGGVDVLAHLLVVVADAEVPEPGRDTGGRILLQEAEVQRPFPGLEHVRRCARA